MKTLTVALPGREYDILIQRGLLDQAGEHCRRTLPRATRLFIVTDSNVGPIYGDRVEEKLAEAGFRTERYTVPAGESAKCAAQLTAQPRRAVNYIDFRAVVNSLYVIIDKQSLSIRGRAP